MDWDSAWHPGDVIKNGVVTLDDVIHDWRETSLVCNVDITDAILPSDAEYLMLTFHVKALQHPCIFSMHGPCLCYGQKDGENKCFVCPDLDDLAESFIQTVNNQFGPCLRLNIMCAKLECVNVQAI